MANKLSKQPRKGDKTPIANARKKLLDEIAESVDRYKKSCKCDDEDAVGVIFGWLFVRAFFYSEIRPWLAAIDENLKAVSQWSKDLADIDNAMQKRYGPSLLEAVSKAQAAVSTAQRQSNK